MRPRGCPSRTIPRTRACRQRGSRSCSGVGGGRGSPQRPPAAAPPLAGGSWGGGGAAVHPPAAPARRPPLQPETVGRRGARRVFDWKPAVNELELAWRDDVAVAVVVRAGGEAVVEGDVAIVVGRRLRERDGWP